MRLREALNETKATECRGKRALMNRWLSELDIRQAMFDVMILVSTIALFVSNEKVAWFHFIFLLLVISAFRLTLIPLLTRVLPAVTAVVVALLIAWSDDLVPVDELFELPILFSMIVVVFLTSSHRKTLTDEIEEQRATIEALHHAARRELQDQLLLSQRLQVTNRLNSTVVHDVNNILAGLRIAAETLTDRSDEPGYVSATGKEIEQYVEQAAQIIKELLASAHMVNSLTPQPGVAVGEALSELEPLLHRLCGKHISLTVSGIDVAAAVDLPRIRLEQILVNLVTNAVDAIPETGGAIRVRAVTTGNAVSLEVSDTGQGIDRADLERVFDPYYTTKRATEDGTEGTGLGLFAVRELLSDAGGSIAVESAAGIGTTLSISLPVRASRTSDTAEPDQPNQHRSGRRRALRLLLADDDELYRRSLAEALRSAGHHVTTAADGNDAHRLFAEAPSSFDVVISDVVMPGRNGIELARSIAEMATDTPVLLMTGHEQMHFDHRITRHTTPLRQKPFATADLLTDLQLIADSLNQ